MITGIIAVAKNNVIGKDNALPWKSIKEDMAFFKKQTMGNIVVMGRKTYESIPAKFRPLAGRINVVVGTTPVVHPMRSEDMPKDTSLIQYTSLESVVADLDGRDAYIIGGASIYKAFEPYMDAFFITRIDKEYEGDTVYVPNTQGMTHKITDTLTDGVTLEYWSKS